MYFHYTQPFSLCVSYYARTCYSTPSYQNDNVWLFWNRHAAERHIKIQWLLEAHGAITAENFSSKPEVSLLSRLIDFSLNAIAERYLSRHGWLKTTKPLRSVEDCLCHTQKRWRLHHFYSGCARACRHPQTFFRRLHRCEAHFTILILLWD